MILNRIYLSIRILVLMLIGFEAIADENQQLHIFSSTNIMGYVRPCG